MKSDQQAYWLALGRFIDAFSRTEEMLQIALRRGSQIDSILEARSFLAFASIPQ
jgi:hypothetical protein